MNWEKLLSNKRAYDLGSTEETSVLYSPFEMDYGTIIGSAIFRRLQDKAQAFPLETDDFVRTRLTHSLEVSSTSKMLGESIFNEAKKQKLDLYFEKNSSKDMCDILLCAGLIHDIGNPPFGHSGEDAIRDWFKINLPVLKFNNIPLDKFLSKQMIMDFYEFEGNAQALRVLSKNRYMGFAGGLNLTFGVLNTIIKYPIKSTEINYIPDNIKYKKIGFYFAEDELFSNITKTTGALKNRHPLTFILEASDDISYKTSDIEDAIVKNILTYSLFLKNLKHFSESYNENQVYKTEFINLIALLESTYEEEVSIEENNPELASIQKWLSFVQKILIKSATIGFCNNYNEIINGTFKYDIFHNTFGNLINIVFNQITEQYIFKNKSKIKIELSGTTIIQFLLDKFVNSILYFDTDYENSQVATKTMELFSRYYKSSYIHHSKNKSESEKLYLRILIATDCISGMTDSYAKKLYQELNGM